MSSILIFTLRGPGERRDKGAKKLFEEIMAENAPNLEEDTDIQVQKAQRVPKKMNTKISTLRYIIIKWQKLKIKIEF